MKLRIQAHRSATVNVSFPIPVLSDNVNSSLSVQPALHGGFVQLSLEDLYCTVCVNQIRISSQPSAQQSPELVLDVDQAFKEQG